VRKLNLKPVLLLLMLVMGVKSQNEKGCGFLFAQDAARRQYPDYDKQLKLIEEFKVNGGSKLSAVTITIPVVFHVLHQNGSEDISDAQIQNAITILTRDFRKNNSDTISIVVQFKNLAADCNIEFKLANIDPNGKCTNGITRHFDEKTDWTPDLAYYTYTWPPSKYLNIYVVKTMQSGAAGYTYLPGTVPPNADAIVMLHNYVGSIGTSNSFTSRTLTHEVGHWLGLPHIWGSTNSPGVACGDDGVTDTPITKGHQSCNLSNAITCTPLVVENIQNYMEYSYCSKMFTIGQSNKMNGVLASTLGNRNSVVSTSNMIATGIINPNYNCAPKAEFNSSILSVCELGTVSFSDYSYNGAVDNWLWSSPGASNTSVMQNGSLTFTSSGLLPVKLKVSNSFGADSITKTNYIVSLANSGASLNTVQDFENGTFPNNQWIGSIPQYGSGFAQTTTVGASGQNCLFINNFIDNPNEPANVFTPKFNLTNVTGAQLSFKYAYSQKGNSNDELRIYITTDCGLTWNLIYTKTGSALATTSPSNAAAFVNPQVSEWKTELVSLLSYQGNSTAHLRFEFTSDPNGSGNNFFIDDINTTGVVGLKELNDLASTITMFPNPAKTTVKLKSNTKVIDEVVMTDVAGRILGVVKGENNFDMQVSLNGISSGIYFLNVKVGDNVVCKKLIIE